MVLIHNKPAFWAGLLSRGQPSVFYEQEALFFSIARTGPSYSVSTCLNFVSIRIIVNAKVKIAPAVPAFLYDPNSW